MTQIIRIIFVFAITLLAGSTAYAQTTLVGQVVGVIDGKTFVMNTERGRITGSIEYVDVPEPEQPLSRIVREHLHRLVMGKAVTFKPHGFSPAALVGKLYLNGMDMGQQLVRDGAAWHVPIARSGQNFDDARPYVGLEILAQAERRGIWSIENLTPAWEFRALKDQSFQDAEFVQTAFNDTPAQDRRGYKLLKADADMWIEVGGDAFAQRNPTGPLFWGYDQTTRIRNVSTRSIAQVLVNGRKPVEVEVRVIYFQGEIRPRATNTAFVLCIYATSREHSFEKENALRFVADGKELEIGGGQRFWRENALAVQELIQYKISSSDLQKIAASSKLTMNVGRFAGTADDDLKQSIAHLLAAAK